jgi:hypothetical protein
MGNRMTEFNDIAGGLGGGGGEPIKEGNPLHLTVIRYDCGQYKLILGRTNPGGGKEAYSHFWLEHTDVRCIANLSDKEPAKQSR